MEKKPIALIKELIPRSNQQPSVGPAPAGLFHIGVQKHRLILYGDLKGRRGALIAEAPYACPGADLIARNRFSLQLAAIQVVHLLGRLDLLQNHRGLILHRFVSEILRQHLIGRQSRQSDPLLFFVPEAEQKSVSRLLTQPKSP